MNSHSRRSSKPLPNATHRHEKGPVDGRKRQPGSAPVRPPRIRKIKAKTAARRLSALKNRIYQTGKGDKHSPVVKLLR
uniref:Uncharacterized protein n=1 Tax=Trichuris muris TaxID=70415 RepID=A0A5S6QWJ3_TRIMR